MFDKMTISYVMAVILGGKSLSISLLMPNDERKFRITNSCPETS
jgi:hypothetical protein